MRMSEKYVVMVSTVVGISVGGVALLREPSVESKRLDRIRQLEVIVENPAASPRAKFDLAFAYHQAGRLEEALPAHLVAAEHPDFRMLGYYNAACALSLMGDPEAAMHYLHLAVAEGYRDTTHMRRDPDLDPLRHRSDFQTLLWTTGPRDTTPPHEPPTIDADRPGWY